MFRSVKSLTVTGGTFYQRGSLRPLPLQPGKDNRTGAAAAEQDGGRVIYRPELLLQPETCSQQQQEEEEEGRHCGVSDTKQPPC